MSIENSPRKDCLGDNFLSNLPHDLIQQRIATLGRENDLFLMLQIEPGYGERHQEAIAKTMAEGLFDDPLLGKAVFGDHVASREEVLPFLKGSSARAKLINEYIQLAIVYQLESEAKKKMNYLQGYIAGRLRGNSIRKLNEMSMAINARKDILTPDLEKERERLIDDVDFAPTLQGELIRALKSLSCIPLFTKFLKQDGITDPEVEIDRLIRSSIEHNVVRERITKLLSHIQRMRKARKRKIAEPRRETKRLAFTAIAPMLEGTGKKHEEKLKHRKRRETATGYLLRDDGIPFMDVDELFEEDIDIDTKPLPATMDASAAKRPDISHFKIPTSSPIPIEGNVREQSEHIPASQVFDEIVRRERSGIIEAVESTNDSKLPVLNLDDNESTDVIPPIPGKALMADNALNLDHVVALVDEERMEEDKTPEPIIDRFSHWVQRHITKIGLVVGVTSIGTAGYYLYRQQQSAEGAGTLKLASQSRSNAKEIQPPAMRRFDESKASKTPPIIKKLPSSNKKSVHISGSTKQQLKKVAAVRGVPSLDNKALVSIDVKTLKDLPNGIYKDMLEGKAFDVSEAPHGSITGFMQQHLMEMAKKLPKKDRRKAMRAYYRNLRKLERGWLIYMSEMEDNLHEKVFAGTITAREGVMLEGWENYKKSHIRRKWQAKWLYKRYKQLESKKSKSGIFAYYRNIRNLGAELMEGLHSLNPGILDLNNVPAGEKVVFVKDGAVLKTLWRFAHDMGLQVPGKSMGSTGELPTKSNNVKFAENVASTSVGQHVSPPPIPESAKVHAVADSDIIQRIPMYGAAPTPEIKPILADMAARRNPPPIPASHTREQQSPDGRINHDGERGEENIASSNCELKPILADMIKKSQNDYDEYTVENAQSDYYAYSVSNLEPKSAISEIDIPRGEDAQEVPAYDEFIIENKPNKITPPPIPASAEIQDSKKKKQGLWGRVKNLFKRAV